MQDVLFKRSHFAKNFPMQTFALFVIIRPDFLLFLIRNCNMTVKTFRGSPALSEFRLTQLQQKIPATSAACHFSVCRVFAFC